MVNKHMKKVFNFAGNQENANQGHRKHYTPDRSVRILKPE